MRPLSITFCLLIVAQIGCQDNGFGRRSFAANDQLPNAASTAKLQAINEAQETAAGAVQNTVNPTKASPSKKVQDSIQQIQQGQCIQAYKAPANTLDSDWSATVQVDSSTCPIHFREDTAFYRKPAKWTFSRSYSVTDPTFQSRLQGLSSMQASGGIQSVTHKGSRDVEGRIHYEPFQLNEIGTVRADIQVKLSTKDTIFNSAPIVGRGVVTLVLKQAKSLVEASVIWESSTPTSYSYVVNRVPVTEASFLQSFSAYQLVEIMDRARKMR